MWFTAADPADALEGNRNRTSNQTAVVFSYSFFYPFNGCSNQALSLNLNRKYQAIEYYMCGPGIYEGDWERVSMYTCVADLVQLLDSSVTPKNASRVIQRMQFSQHSWQPE